VARGSARGRRLLVVAEVALGVVLLVGAGLLIRSFLYLSALNPGFDPSNVVTATISLQDARYVDAGRINRLFSDSLERIRRQPGVESAGVTLGLPYTRLLNMGFGRVEGATDEDKGGMTNVSYVTPGYFEALKVFPRTGRLFTDADQSGSLPVAIVNEQFAKRFYKGQEIRGLHLRVAGVREVIGVIPNARATSSGLGGDNGPLPEPAIVYIPATQTPSGFFTGVHIWFSPSWTVRSRGPVAGLPGQIREALTADDDRCPGGRARAAALHDEPRRRSRRRGAAAGGDRDPRSDLELRQRAHARTRDPAGAGRYRATDDDDRGDARCDAGRDWRRHR